MSSDNESTKGGSPAKTEKKAVVFTEREEMVLKVAWRCLKSGPPEVSCAQTTSPASHLTFSDRHREAHQGRRLQHPEDLLQYVVRFEEKASH